MSITFCSDFIYVIAMLKTSPLVATVGLSLTIPFAVMGDYFLATPAKAQALIGGLLVLASFAVVSFPRTETQNIGMVQEAEVAEAQNNEG